MNGWLIAMIVLYGLNLLMTANLHKTQKTITYNFWTSLIFGGVQLLVIIMAVRGGW